MSELVIRNQRQLPDEVFSEGGNVGFIVEEMIGTLVNDCERAKGAPLWTSLYVSITEDEKFPGAKIVRVSLKCSVNLTGAMSR